MYRHAREGLFDLYELLRRFLAWLGRIFSTLHTGILHDYTLWIIAGLVILLILLVT